MVRTSSVIQIHTPKNVDRGLVLIFIFRLMSQPIWVQKSNLKLLQFNTVQCNPMNSLRNSYILIDIIWKPLDSFSISLISIGNHCNCLVLGYFFGFFGFFGFLNCLASWALDHVSPFRLLEKPKKPKKPKNPKNPQNPQKSNKTKRFQWFLMEINELLKKLLYFDGFLVKIIGFL